MQGMAGFFLHLGSTKLCYFRCSPRKKMSPRLRFACVVHGKTNIQTYSYQMVMKFMVMNPMVVESLKKSPTKQIPNKYTILVIV